MIKNKKKTSKFIAVLSAVIAAVMLSITVFAGGILSGIARGNDISAEYQIENISLLYNELINSEDFSETNIQITAMDSNGENIIKCGDNFNSIKPASSFRYIPLIIALKCGAADLNLQINCTGSIDDNFLRCYKNDGHGQINIIEAFSQSCITGYNELAKLLSKDIFMNYYNIQLNGEISKFDNLDMTDIVMGRKFSISPEELLNIYRFIVNNDYNYIDEVIKENIIYDENSVKIYKISGISDEPVVQSKIYIVDYNNSKYFILASLDGIDSSNKIDEYIISDLSGLSTNTDAGIEEAGTELLNTLLTRQGESFKTGNSINTNDIFIKSESTDLYNYYLKWYLGTTKAMGKYWTDYKYDLDLTDINGNELTFSAGLEYGRVVSKFKSGIYDYRYKITLEQADGKYYISSIETNEDHYLSFIRLTEEYDAVLKTNTKITMDDKVSALIADSYKLREEFDAMKPDRKN